MSEDKIFISIIYDKNKKRCRLISESFEIIQCIIRHFTTENGAAFFIEQQGYSISNEISVINALGYFDLGLFPLVYKAVKEYYPNENIVIPEKELIINKIFPLRNILNVDDIKNITNKYDIRPYQNEAIKACLKYGRGIIECPTASGKSFIIGNIIYNLNMSRLGSMMSSIMIYVPTRQLVDQFYLDLLDYGFTKNQICKFTSNSGKKKNKTFEDNSCSEGFNQIIITNRTFAGLHKDKFPKINVLFCDEVHTLSPDSSSINFIKSLDTDIKIGFTGTVPKEDFKKWTLIGTFGTILFTESIINLQNQKYLAPLKIISLDVYDIEVNNSHDLLFSLKTNKKFDKEDLSEEALKFNDAYNAEIEYINKNLFKLYKKPLEHICNSPDNKNILVLFDRIEFGRGIYEEAKSSLIDLNICYIDGSIDVRVREDIRKEFEEKNGGLLFAQSSTFSTGINIKNLDCIAFFFSGKGYVKILQSIGRTLRLHKDKETAKLYDVSFNYKYSQKHKIERLSIYNESYGKIGFDETVKIVI